MLSILLLASERAIGDIDSNENGLCHHDKLDPRDQHSPQGSRAAYVSGPCYSPFASSFDQT